MRRSLLPILRRTGAALVFGVLLVAFIDFHGAFAKPGHVLASTQFVPSAIALAIGVSHSLACLLVLVLTLAIGRVYCSVLCPLGVLQDLVARVRGKLRPRRTALRFRPAHRWLRLAILGGTVAGIAAGWSGLTLALLDPYSIFGRIVSDLARPVVVWLNNLLTTIGVPALNRVELPWIGLGALAVPVLSLLVVAALAAWRGRLYCNTVCPVGTALGLLSRYSAFRLQIDRAACEKCGDCLAVCKAQCIDLRTQTIDASRCVQCYNCIGACDRSSLALRWAWRRPRTVSPPLLRNPEVDLPRRAFVSGLSAAFTAAIGASTILALTGVKRSADGNADTEPADPAPTAPRTPSRRNLSPVIAPPGAGSIERFLDRCTACHLCVSTCPTHVLQPAFLDYGLAGLAKPRMDYGVAFCNFDCHRCADVCPDGALTPLTLETKHAAKIGEAQLDIEQCIVKTQGTDCAACSEHCPTKAVDTKPYGDNLRLPWVHRESCIGCGACEFACPAQPKAIRVSGLKRHGEVWLRPAEQAADPRAPGDFPF